MVFFNDGFLAVLVVLVVFLNGFDSFLDGFGGFF